MPDKIALSTIASFAAHLTEMLESATDRPELVKRYGAALARLRASLNEVLARTT
jgi:hypothetical protein